MTLNYILQIEYTKRWFLSKNKEKKMYSNRIILTSILSLSIISNGFAMEHPIPADPDLIVDIKNKTHNTYNIVTESGNSTVLEAGQSTRLNLSKEWQNHPFTHPSYNAKELTLYIKDTYGTKKMRAEFELLPISGLLKINFSGESLHYQLLFKIINLQKDQAF